MATAACLALGTPSMHAQDKPPLRILIGFPPGGGTDAIARAITDKLAIELGQAIVIDNKPGAGGRIAAELLMAAPADGSTWMIAPNATPTFLTLVFGPQLKWNLWRDFAPVAGLVSYPLGMAVSLNTGASNVREFVDWVKRNPKASFGTPGLGGQNHFLGLQFAKLAGIDLPVTPYKGSPPLITDLLGGHVPAAVSLMDGMLAQHRAGKLRVVGIFSDKRSELMPDIPTMAEQGINVSSGDGWNAMWAPVRTPPEVIERMQRAVQKVLATPEMRELLMSKLAAVPHFRSSAEMERAQRAELAYWEPVIKASGFKPE